MSKLRGRSGGRNGKFIAYFQNFTSTYGNADELCAKYSEALSCDDVVGIAIATRPDSLGEKILDFLEYRKEIKKPYKSERGIKSLVSQIEKQEQAIGSIAVIRVIDTSMQNGWQGLFWDKVQKPKNTAADMAEIARMMDEGVL
jgi:radical SAM superfamily enzyme